MKYGDLLVVAFMEMKMQLWRAFSYESSLSLSVSVSLYGVEDVAKFTYFLYFVYVFIFFRKAEKREQNFIFFERIGILVQRFEKILRAYLRRNFGRSFKILGIDFFPRYIYFVQLQNRSTIFFVKRENSFQILIFKIFQNIRRKSEAVSTMEKERNKERKKEGIYTSFL